MSKLTRRKFLACAAAAPAVLRAAKSTDIRIEEIKFGYEDFTYRAPLKFGGAIVDRVTLLNVDCVVRSSSGRTAKGFGSMPMGNIWAFPSQKLTYDDTLNAMKVLAGRINKITAAYNGLGHPIDINETLEPEYLKAAGEVTKELNLVQPIPKLCMQVTASPFDAAIHDAFGKLHGLNVYHTYGPEFMSHDLSHYLGPQFKGEYLDRYVSREPKPRMPLYHLIGAVDPLVDADISKRLNDGLPETVPEWIRAEGLTHLKVKLNGSELKWDVDRVVSVERITAETQKKRGVSKWFYSLDFNEKCPNVAYLMDFLRQVKEQAPAAFERIQYIEQPTARDLKTDRENVMHEAAKLRPVVIDESLTDMETLLLARERGYTGVALKACKQQSQAMLMAAAAQKFKMFLCVQDLTCPGASLIHSAGIAAHVHGMAGIEANARQYVPAANKPWEPRFPGVFRIKGGVMNTAILNRPGLGAV
jgi:L-alanine-DL-glutamate epimerase-like enolase superfamily enzyme